MDLWERRHYSFSRDRFGYWTFSIDFGNKELEANIPNLIEYEAFLKKTREASLEKRGNWSMSDQQQRILMSIELGASHQTLLKIGASSQHSVTKSLLLS